MAFSDSEPTPLRHRDLDTLSDRELEGLLFDGRLPKKRRSWRKPLTFGAFGTGALLLLTAGGPEVAFPAAAVAGFLLFGILAAKRAYTKISSWRPRFSYGRESLVRASLDRKVAGVCGGLAAYFDVDSTLVRFAFIMGLVMTSGAPMILAYVLLAWLLPTDAVETAEERLRIIRES